MLVTFKCDAHESITMFGNIGKRLLEMMGYNGKLSGEISADDIPKVRLRLRTAIDDDKSAPIQTGEKNTDDEDEKEPEVSLKHRAFPLFEMLDAAEKEKCKVKWTTT